jgi:hypothetical protein
MEKKMDAVMHAERLPSLFLRLDIHKAFDTVN